MRRIKSAQIRFLTLCKRGKNRCPVLYKADDGTEQAQFQTIVKASGDFQDSGELLAVAYPNEWRDKDGHIADEAVCKEMAYSFMQEGANLDIRHDGKKIEKSRAYVAENFVIQKSDPRFDNFTDYDGNEIDVAGSWGVVIKIEDKELRRLYKEEGWNGVSLQGSAELIEDTNTQDNHVEKALAFYKAHLDAQGEDDLKPEELTKAFTDNNKPLADMIVAGLTAVLAPKEPVKKEEAKDDKEKDKPVFKGDISKAEDVAAFAKEVKIYNLRKTVDFSDPKQIDNFAKQLAEINKTEDDADASDEDESDELRAARRLIAKADGSSDIPVRKDPIAKAQGGNSKSKLPPVLQSCNLEKEEIEGYGAGQRMAKFLNDKNKA